MLEKLKKYFPLIIICVFGAFLRFYKLSFLVFHWDESPHTVQIAAKSLSFVLTHDYGSIVYQFLVHILLPFGKLEFVSRLPAALFGVLIILGTYYVGKLFFGKKTGLAAALFVSFSHYFLSYSQYARAYTIFTFFSLLSLIVFYKAIKENKTKYWILYVIISAINVYTHLITLITILSYAAFVGILLLDKKFKVLKDKSWQIDKSRLIRFVFCTFSVLVITFVLRLPVVEMDRELNNLDWIAKTLSRFLGEPTVGLFPLIHRIFTNQINYFPSLLYLMAVFFIVLGILASLFRFRKKDILILVSTLLPILSFYLIKPPPNLFLVADRYLILPFFFILSVRGIILLSSLLVSLTSSLRAFKKKAQYYKNLSFVVFVGIFFLLECMSLIGYSNYDWKIRSISLSKNVQSLLMAKARKRDIIFSNSFFENSNVLQVIPLTLNRGQSKLIIQSRPSRFWNEFSGDALGLWLVIDHSLLDEKNTKTFNENLEGREIINIEEKSLIYWKPKGKTLSKKLIEMMDILIPLHPNREMEYCLLQAKFYLLDQNIERALEMLERAENNGFLSRDGKQTHESTLSSLNLINTFVGDFRGYRQIVLDTLKVDIGKQLLLLGNILFAEEKWDEGVKALDKCVQISEELHKAVSQRYLFYGNQFLRSGRIDEAVGFLKKAVDLNPSNYFYHLILAEAYWSKNMPEDAVREYRLGFNDSSVSDKFIYQMISKPRLFAIWKDKATWHFLWRSDEKSEFVGNFYFGKKVDRMQKHHFSKRDTVNQYKDYAVEFNFPIMERRIKSLDIEAGRKSVLTCYIKMNDRLMTNEIVFINTGENPKQIPFTLTEEGFQPDDVQN